MRLLLDTHGLLWWLFTDPRLSLQARDLVADASNRVFVSAASLAEIAIKIAKNKGPMPPGFEDDLLASIGASGFMPLPITMEHAYALRHLPWHHRDPFDRLLVAQSTLEGMTLVTKDPLIRRYDVNCLW